MRKKGKSLAENSPPAVHYKIVQAVKMLSQPEREEIFQALDRLSRLVDVGDADRDPALPPVIQQAKNAVSHLRAHPQN